MPAVTRTRKQTKEVQEPAAVNVNLSIDEQKRKAKEWAESQGIFQGKKTPATNEHKGKFLRTLFIINLSSYV